MSDDRCYVCGRTTSECRDYIIKHTNDNFDFYYQKFFLKRSSSYKDPLTEVEKDVERVRTTMEIKEKLIECKSLLKGKSLKEQSLILIKLHDAAINRQKVDNVDCLQLLVTYFLSNLDDDFITKFGDWDNEKYRVAMEINHPIEEGYEYALRFIFKDGVVGKKTAIKPIIYGKKEQIKSLEDFEEYDPWEGYKNDSKKILLEKSKNYNIVYRERNGFELPVCVICRALTETDYR